MTARMKKRVSGVEVVALRLVSDRFAEGRLVPEPQVV